MEEKPFEFKYFVIDDIYRDVLNSDDTFEISFAKCWVSLCGYINSDTISSIIVITEMFAVAIMTDIEMYMHNFKHLKEMFELFDKIDAKNIFTPVEYEYLKNDIQIVKEYYNKGKKVIKEEFPRRASDFFEEIPKFYVEKVLLGEDPNHRLENITEDNSFELDYLIYAYYYRGIFKDKLTEQQAFDRCLIKFKKYLEEDSIKTVIVVAALTNILVWSKELDLTRKFKSLIDKTAELYKTFDVKSILSGDRLEFLEDSMRDINGLYKYELPE
ncbi:hypothetical protein [Lachnobacterium bovis]|uniref:Uncharacterized protein n=1 Tax=Lachnobacterium bovis DSM 14045 TaxID=1122142 RepID=A0A1H3N2W8_9FIRM|nr:hypothetical protein [Lachnobacterium bovis]SDY82589.1 hypothetical protein SAMN02910414_02456 [Lachnobacterium bovis DSM 14045]